MFILSLIILLIVIIIIFYILTNSTSFHDQIGFKKFSSIWHSECETTKMRNETPEFDNDITICDFIMKEIDINGGRLLYLEVLKNHEISDLELKKLEMIADIYPFDPQLVLFMHLKTKYHGNLASKYAYDLLSKKYKPWFYRIH